MTNVWVIEHQALAGESWFFLRAFESRAEARAWAKDNANKFYALRVVKFVRAGE